MLYDCVRLRLLVVDCWRTLLNVLYEVVPMQDTVKLLVVVLLVVESVDSTSKGACLSQVVGVVCHVELKRYVGQLSILPCWLLESWSFTSDFG